MTAAPAPRSASPIDPLALNRVLRRLARADEAPWLYQEVARRMADRLVVMRTPAERWLDWSGLLGAGQAPVAAVWPRAQATVVEPVPELQSRSRAALRGPWWKGGRPRAAVLSPAEVPEGQAQMLWANLQLHAAPDVPALLGQWHRALAVDGVLMFSCFGPDTLRELRTLYAEAGWPPPHPPYADMHDIGDALVHAGFADPVMDQERLVLHWSGAQALLAELRGWGGHIGRGRFAGLRTPRWRERLVQALEARRDAEGRIRLSVELVYGHALKPAPRPPRAAPDAPQVVRLDRLRERLGTASPARPGNDPGQG